MLVNLFCPYCALEASQRKDPDFAIPVPIVRLRDDGVYPVRCGRGHDARVRLRNLRFELLFEMGVYALHDGYTRAAVSSCVAALERFYEFYVAVTAEASNVGPEELALAWKAVSRQSERQSAAGAASSSRGSRSGGGKAGRHGAGHRYESVEGAGRRLMAPNQLFDRDTMNAPWGLPARLLLVRMACTFFNAAKLADSYKLIGREVPKGRNLEPLTANDFLKCLEASNAFPKPPNGLRVMQLIDGMVSGGLLVRAGYGNRSFAGMGDHYVHVTAEWDARREHFRYAPVLGPEFLYYLCAPGLVHITGTGKKTGDAAAGTGLIVHPSYVLTCRHVVTDMLVDQKQTIQGQEYAVNEGSVFRHPAVDVAVIRVDGPPMSGYTLPYPISCGRLIRLPRTCWSE